MGESNRVSVRLIEEVTFGTTPDTPTLEEILRTGGGLKGVTETVVSNAVRSDRMRQGMFRTGQHVEGGYDFELAYGQFDTLLEGALGADWSAAIALSGTTYAAVASDDSITDSGNGFVAAGLVAGMWVLISGFVTAANNGLFRIATVAVGKLTFDAYISLTAKAYTTAPTLTDESAGPTVKIRNQGMLRNGSTAKSYTVEQAHLDSSQFFAFRGCRVGGLSLSIPAKALVTGNLSFMGKSFARAGTTIASSVTAPNSNKAFNTTEDIWGIAEGAAALTDFLTELTLSIENNLRMNDAIGNLTPPAIPLGTQDITGQIGLYVGSGSGTMLDKYINFTESSRSFIITNGTSPVYYIVTIPAYRYSGETPDAGGLDADVIATMPFTAYVNSAGTYQIQFDRITTT